MAQSIVSEDHYLSPDDFLDLAKKHGITKLEEIFNKSLIPKNSWKKWLYTRNKDYSRRIVSPASQTILYLVAKLEGWL